MSNKELKARIQLKNDTPESWETASQAGFIPKLGEPIFYKEQDGDGFKFPKMKIGDGVRTPDELPSYSGSWDDLTDKPFGEETFTPIMFDGNTEGYEVIENIYGYSLVKISDTYYYNNELVGAIVSVDLGSLGGPIMEFPLIESECHIGNEINSNDEETLAFYTYVENSLTPTPLVMSIHSAETITFPSASGSFSRSFTEGLYMMGVDIGTYLPTTLTFPEQIKQLDEKYIPDTIARVSDIPESQIQSDWNQTDDTQADFIKNKPTIPSIEGLATEEYVDNAVANAGGGSGGAGYGNAPIQKWEMNLTSDSDKTYSFAFTKTGSTVYEGNLFISVVDACGQSWTGGQNVILAIDGVDLTGYEIFKNIVVRPNKQWYWTTYETTFSEESAGQGVDTHAEFATSSSVVLQLYNRQGSYIYIGTEDQCWGLKVKVDTNTRIISISIAEGGSVLF